MAAIISMLRAVNVGGHNKIKMDALRVLYESLKLREPQSYVQSGNVVFKTDERDLVRLTKKIENAIEGTFGFRPDVVLRTSSDLRDVVAKNPFAKRRDIEPGRLQVHFLASDPGAEARANVLKLKTDPEELCVYGRELFIYFLNGMGKSKLSWAAVNKALKTPGTCRNWNTVTKLLEMAESLEADTEIVGKKK
jgi:uncharacterized protein (DUF1697 family)